MNTSEQIIKQLLMVWANQNQQVRDFYNQYEEAAYMERVAPGRNRAVYIFGHLISSNDNLLPLLDLGERMYPELKEIFGKEPEKTIDRIPPLAELKHKWEEVYNRLTGHFNSFTPEQWLERHTAVSAEDFAKEPHRNKLNILITRTSHLAYHLGQLRLIQAKTPA